MSSQQLPRRQSRGGGEARPAPPRVDSARSVSTASVATTLPSIDTTERTIKSSATPTPSPSLATQNNAHIFRVPESPRNASVAVNSNEKGAKVAIPRLKRSVDFDAEGSTRSGGRHRVNHACEPCRHRKTKCSGERPICRHCQDFKISCYYADGKRDRVKK